MHEPDTLTLQPSSRFPLVSSLVCVKPQSVGSGPPVQSDELHKHVQPYQSDVGAKPVETGETLKVLLEVAYPLANSLDRCLDAFPCGNGREAVQGHQLGCVLYGTCQRSVVPE